MSSKAGINPIQLSKSYNGGIVCHAFNGDGTQLAICPNNNELHIYRKGASGEWKLEHTLNEHDMLISGVDWNASSNCIVTCSHDRNAFVWNEETNAEGKITWKPALVILRIDKSALDVKWSPNGLKFAAASGAKCVSVCSFEEGENWWVSKSIKKHKSTVTCLAWHPNSQFLATGSTDFKCRVFSAVITNGATGKPDAPGSEQPCCGKVEAFGEVYGEFPSAGKSGVGWIGAVAWSPSGATLAFAGQDSCVGVVAFPVDGGAAVVERYVRFAELPLTSLCFVSDIAFVGAGHEFSPLAFVDTGGGEWTLAGPLEEKPAKETKPAASAAGGGGGGGIASARAMFEKSSGGGGGGAGGGRGGGSSGSSSGGSGRKEDSSWKAHKSAVTALSVHGVSKAPASGVPTLSSTGMDGRLVLWDLTKVPIPAAALGVA